MSKSRIFFWLNIAFIAGIAAASYFFVSLTVVWAVFIFGVIATVSALRRHGVRQPALVAGACCITAAFGMFWFLWRGAADLPLESTVGAPAIIEGVIAAEPRRTARSQQIVIEESMTNARILIGTERFPEYAYGDRVAAAGIVKHPENFSDDFDYAAFLAKDDIYYTMAFPKITILGTGAASPVRHMLFSIKNAFAASLERTFPEPHAAYLKGLLLGERQSFSEELREDLRRTGTAHIVALSGYNIGIVASGLMALLRWLWVPFGAAFWGATFGIIGFVALTGAQASVVRAAIMGTLVLVAAREGRPYHMRNALAFAAAAMLWENPKLLRFDVAFQLSFLATVGVVWGSPLVAAWFRRIGARLHIWLREHGVVREQRGGGLRERRSLFVETLATTIAAQLAVSPLLVLTFGELSLISPIANAMVLVLIPYTMALGFVTGLVGMVAPVAALPLGWMTRALTSYELGVIEALGGISYAAINDRRVGMAIVAGIALGIAAALVWRRMRARALVIL
ncbi:ComEC family competence protein [Candidatus Parcubacteria bacterium]|nr:MAG: ComEC family competence protein [Candidatus Parcubacteria bacterium]